MSGPRGPPGAPAASGAAGGSAASGGPPGGSGGPGGSAGESGGSGTGGSGGGAGSLGGPTECDDGIDNDDDGLTDWQEDLGCYGPADGTEAALPRSEEDGFTTFDIGADSVVVYVAADGDDSASGASPGEAVQTLSRAAAIVRDGENDFILLKRGDTFRDQSLGRFKSGRDRAHPLVVAGYGDSMELPRLETSGFFINHDGQVRSFVSIVGLHFVVARNDPDDPSFDGAGEGVFRYVGGGTDLLIEGCHLEYGEIVVQSYQTELPTSGLFIIAKRFAR
jgi:hypothetical protein